MDEFIWKIISVLGTVVGGYVIFSEILRKFKKDGAEEKLGQVEANNALELKVKELEGKISTQYSELKSQIQGVERVLAEDKVSKLAFENRVIASVDKIDAKMERIQDLVLRVFVDNNKQKQ
jgi:predicted amino acid racemase